MAIPLEVSNLLNSVQIVGLPARANIGDELRPTLSPANIADTLDALAQPQTLADINLRALLDDIVLTLTAPASSATQQSEVTLDVVMKAVEFAGPVETTADAVNTGAVAQNELHYLVPTKVTAVPPYTLAVSDKVEGLLGKLSGTVGQLDILKQVEKLAGHLGGTITGTITRTILSQALALQVRWRVEDASGRPLVPSTDYALLKETTLTDLAPAFVFLPQFTEFSAADVLVSQRRIFCDVKLVKKAKPQDPPEASVTLGPITVEVPRVPFPTVLAMTEHAKTSANFPGAVLISVPATSALGSLDNLNGPLDAVRKVVENLKFLGVTGFDDLLSGMDTLAGLLGASNVRFLKADRVDDLSTVTREPSTIPWITGSSWEDTVSALVLIGPPNRAVKCHNRRNLWIGTGAFEVRVGLTGSVVVETLDQVTPVSIPPEALTVTNPADKTKGNTFNDCISSFQFLPYVAP